MDLKLLGFIKTIISRGGEIYKVTSSGVKIIDHCTRTTLKADIEAFKINERDTSFVQQPTGRV